jgi:hypothetical protein
VTYWHIHSLYRNKHRGGRKNKKEGREGENEKE